MQKEHEEAKEFGEAAAEEWVKGLPLNGKQQMADAARWERWEALHPPGTHPAKILREYFRPVSAISAPVSEHTLAAAPPAVHANRPPSNGSSQQVLSHQQPSKYSPTKRCNFHTRLLCSSGDDDDDDNDGGNAVIVFFSFFPFFPHLPCLMLLSRCIILPGASILILPQ